MKTVLKACPCVLRQGRNHADILVFEHPLAGWQIPKGTVEPGEPLEQATLRELREESGIADAHIVRRIGIIERLTGSGRDESGPVETHIWHLFHLQASPDIESRERWIHVAEGSEIERSLSFTFFWFDVQSELSRFHPFWENVFVKVRSYLGERKSA